MIIMKLKLTRIKNDYYGNPRYEAVIYTDDDARLSLEATQQILNARKNKARTIVSFYEDAKQYAGAFGLTLID